MAGIHFPITGDNSNFIRSLNEVTASVRDASRQIEAEGGSIEAVFNKIKGGIAALGAGWGFKEILGTIANTRGEFQKLEIAFETFLGSAEKRDVLMSQLIHTAAVTPFEMSDVANGAKMLLAYGVAAEDVNSTLIKLGDLAAGLSVPLNDIMYLYGTTISKPKMDTNDLIQFMGRGIPMAKALADQFGVAEDKVRSLITAGKVGREEVIKAIDSLTGEGSMFGGLMEAQSASIDGQISNIQDAIEQMFNEVGKSTEGVMNVTLGATGTIVENWQTVLLILGDIAAAYGVEKAVLAGTSAVATSAYSAELTALSSLIPVKKESVNLDIQEALAKGRITEATASKVIAMRKEVASYMESLAASKATATAEAQAAAQKYRSALQQSLAAKATLEAKRQELVASGEICGAYISENAVKEMGIATDKAKQASIQATIAKQEYHSAVTKKKIATEALDTANINANTVSQNLNARSTNIVTVAKEALTKSTQKLYATMMAHPYALIAAAVVALGYGIYKLVTYQTDYEKSLSRLDDAFKKGQQSLAKENIEIERHFGKLNSAKKGTKEWDEARNNIWSKYGQYLKSLGDEKTALNDVAKAYALVKEEAEKAAKARAMESFIQSEGESYANKIGDLRSQALRMVEKRYGEEFAAKHQEDIINLVEGRAIANKEFMMNMNTKDGFFGRAGNFSRLLAQAQEERDNYDKILKEAEDKFKMTSSSLNKRGGDEVKETTLKEAYDKAKNDYKTAKAEVAKMEANRSAYTQKAYEEAVSNLKGYKDAYEKLGGTTKSKSSGTTPEQTASKIASEHQQLLDLIKRQAEERMRLRQDYEYQEWQNRIDLMQEGETKVIAQMQLDHAKEKTTLEEQKKQAIDAEIARQKAVWDAQEEEKAARQKGYGKQVFNPETNVDQTEIKTITDRYDKLQDYLTKKHEDAEKNRIANDMMEMNQYLQNYGTFQQQKLAIAEEYAEKIKKATNEAQRLTFAKERDSKIAQVNANSMLMDIDWSMAFEGVGNVLRDMAKETLDKIESYMKTDSYNNLDAADKKAYLDVRDKLRNEGVGNSTSPFNFKIWDDIAKQTKEYQESINNLSLSTSKHEMAINSLISAKEKESKAIEKLNSATTDAEKAIAQSELDIAKAGVEMAQQAVDLTAQDVKDKQNDTNDKKDNLKSSTDKAVTGLNNFANTIGEISNGSLFGFANGISKLVTSLLRGSDGVGKSLGELGGKIGGLIGAILQIIDALGDDPNQFIDDLLMKISTVVETVISELPEIVVTILKDVGNIVMGLGSGLFKMVGLDINFNGSNAKEVAETTNRLTYRNELLQKSIDNLKSSIDKSYGGGAIYDYQQAMKAQKVANENLRQILNAQQGYHDNHHSNAYYWNMSREDTDAINALLGTSLRGSSWEDWSRLTAEQMNQIRTYRSDIWQRMLEQGEYDKSEYFENYADAAGKIEELTEQIRENLLGVSFEGLRDDFISKLMDMSAESEDFANSLTEMLQKSFLQAMIGDKFDEQIKDWYKRITDAMMNEDGSFKELSEEQLIAFQAEWDAMSSMMMEERDRIAEITGYGLDQIKEKLTDISFDSVRDSYKSLLTDMESSTEDFSDNFTDMIRNALVESLMNNKYDSMLKEWYDEFAEAMNDHALTDTERDALRQRYDAIVQQGIADRNAINDIVGGGSYSQSASTGGWETMGQDQAEELNGRFTALTELEAINNSLVSDGNALAREILTAIQSMRGMSAVTDSGDNSLLLSIKDMMFLSTGYLEDIARYAKWLITISGGIDELRNLIDKRL